MDILFNIFTQLAPIVASSLVSYFIARAQARNEIKKTKLSFEREDRKIFDTAFAELLIRTQEYCSCQTEQNLCSAVEANAKLLTCAPKEFCATTKRMDEALKMEDKIHISCVRKELLELYSTTK